MMMQRRKYIVSDKMSDLISENYFLIQVISRFGIKVGFGDKSVSEVCEKFGVDCTTFLTVVNFIQDGYSKVENLSELSVTSLLDYLKQSHIYFLEYCLPAIRRKLVEGITLSSEDVSFLILKFFDEYTSEVRLHMEHEEQSVFAYVNRLISGGAEDDYKISTYSNHHEQVGNKLKELKNILIRYCPNNADVNLLNDALYDIYRCEQELESHCMIEDYVFTPAVMKLERRVKDNER